MARIEKASHDGELKIGQLIIPCAVVNGKRLLSSRGVIKALGGSRPSGRHYQKRKESDGVELPAFVAYPNLKPFIDKDLATALNSPIRYFPTRGGGTPAIGLPAELLPAVCEAWLKAREAGEVPARQKHIAEAAEMIVRGLAHIGIVALVDEATGYQEIRDREALQKLLDKFLTADRAKWAKRFPDEFYENLFRLKGWRFRPLTVKRPSVVGHWTNDIVYDRLAPGVLEKLQELNPTIEPGQRPHRHHQHFTDIGVPALTTHLANTIFLMRGSSNWTDFYRTLNRAAPKQGDMPKLPFDDADNI